MKRKSSIGIRLLLPVATATVIFSIVLYWVAGSAVERMTSDNLAKLVRSKISDVQRIEEQIGDKLLAEASLFSRDQAVIAAYRVAYQGDLGNPDDPFMEKARGILRGYFSTVEKGYREVFKKSFHIHFHLPPARSLLRLWKQDQHSSDDLTDFRNTIKKISQRPHEPIAGIEIGRGGFAIRGLAPVLDGNGKYYGSVEVLSSYLPLVKNSISSEHESFAVYMNKEFLPIATKLQNAAINPVLDNRFVFVTSTNRKLTDSLLAPDFLEEGELGASSRRIGDYFVTVFPVKDFAGKQIGVMAFSYDAADTYAGMKKIKWGIAILCLLLLAAIILPLLWGLRSVLLPIRQTVDMLRDIAEGDGDLTRRLDIVRQDEVGELAWNFNEFIDKLQSLIAQVADNTVVLESAAVKMTGIAGRVDDVARDNSERVKNVAVSMEQMSDSFSSVADLTEQSSGSISMVGTASEELTATIGELEQKAEMASEVCEEARSKTGDTSIQMAKLGDAAQAIGKVLETISEISEQVNLLALNATIEAARAGDAGKGFAVVANEIKELAKQTAEATVEIRENIENIQSRTELTVREIAEIAEVNSHVSEIVSGIAISVGEQSSATREIAENISRVSHNVMEVNESVGQNSSVAEEVAGDISEVQEKVHTLVGSSRELNGSVEELNQVTVELNTVVGKFKI